MSHQGHTYHIDTVSRSTEKITHCILPGSTTTMMNNAARKSLRPAALFIRYGCSRLQAKQGPSSEASRQCLTFSSSNDSTKRRPDPMAKRPNFRCDPYGQGGKPLALEEAESLLSTIDKAWEIEKEGEKPWAIVREFIHPDFLNGASFVGKMAAVAEMNAHFPSVTLDRRIVCKQWQVVTQIRCHTFVLGGLSTHDFHLAMVRTSASEGIHSLIFPVLTIVFTPILVH